MPDMANKPNIMRSNILHENKASFRPPALGGVSLLVIFAVLCLTVFALLSLSTVQADIRLADASAKAVTDYYAADAAAEEILAQLRSGQVPENVTPTGENAYAYSIAINDNLQLEVAVQLSADGSWRVNRWQAVPDSSWEYDDSLTVWDGLEF